MFRIGIAALAVPRSAPHWVGFEQGLRDLGFVEGQNLALDFLLFLDGKTDRLKPAMTELMRRNVDVIVASGEATVTAALEATNTIPIVMVAIDFDPLYSAIFRASRGRAATSPGFSSAISS